MTLVMDYAVNFGLSWTQVEHLMKLVGFILKRSDLPDMKFLFKKFAGTVKYPVSGTSSPDKTKEGALQYIKGAHRTGVHVRGVKGPSPLISLPGFDIVWSFSPDYMHCVLLGVTRQFTELWMSKVGAPYYIGSPQLIKIDDRLCATKPPQCITRMPRSVQLRKFWKASEWQQWLSYYSLVCVDGVLPCKYIEHFSLLARGVFLLLADVSTEDVHQSTELLAKFVVGVQFLYSEREITSNVHLLMHLAKSVLMQGPLWAHSCFVFEGGIGKIKKLITSAKGVPHQIMGRVLTASKVGACNATASHHIKDFLGVGFHKMEPIALLGKPRPASASLVGLVEAQIPHQITGPVEEHDRIRMSGYVFHSEQYQRPDRIDCTAVWLPDNTHAKIQRIVSVSCSDSKRTYFVSKGYRSMCCYGTGHISRVEKCMPLKLVEVYSKSVVMNCKSLTTAPTDGTTLQQALGFSPTDAPDGAEWCAKPCCHQILEPLHDLLATSRNGSGTLFWSQEAMEAFRKVKEV
ncbi:LOW QUALITY PROTEIN: uncharacterized protein LOC119397124 [Rhipicephalus sanguineus]|uniref:LOW QUALITY PROTEIN: uncharacterized protein LOC119397124 n=1 Tax=Rhipicephalus sanguineus TaxID=34632 RepID=UPI0020C2A9D0|nr:LOW QUALITY PROTEIN: uncharacterized protein LOC119397124 [Rhipicephalus sanguineus]